MRRARQLAIVAAGWLVLAAVASGQVNITENTAVNLSGNMTFGYNGLFSEVTSNQLVFGGNADLTGYYYDPKFLSFRFSPYYNQQRVNSDYNSVFSGKGFAGSASLFGGSHTPVEVSYSRDWNSEGTFSVPGALGFTTQGHSQSFSVGGGMYFEGLPTLHASFSMNKNGYSLVGSDEDGSSNSRAFSIGSTYSRFGFNFNGTYSKMHLEQHTPPLFNSIFLGDQNTDQSTFQVGANRQLWKNATFSTSYARTHFLTDYAGQQTDATYDTVNGNFGWRPTEKLILGASANYTTNFGAYLLGTLAPGNPAPPAVQPLFRDSKYFNYGGHATYLLSKDITLDGGVDRTSQDFVGVEIATTNVSGGAGYRHALWGGQFGAQYGLSLYTSPTNDQRATGQSGSVTFSRTVGNWRSTAGVQYNSNVMTAVLGYTQTGYGLNASTSRNFGEWFVTFAGRVGKSSIDGTSLADSLSTSYSATVSRRKYSFSGSFSRNSGESLPTINGLLPSPIPGPIPGLLIFYSGRSYAFGGSYQPTSKWKVSGSYLNSTYETDNLSTVSDNMVRRLDCRTEYRWRQMTIQGSYTYLRQGIGAGFVQPQTVHAIYFGVSRHFDIF